MHTIDFVLLCIIFFVFALCIAQIAKGMMSSCNSCGSKKSCPAHAELPLFRRGSIDKDLLARESISCPMAQDMLSRMEHKLASNSSERQ